MVNFIYNLNRIYTRVVFFLELLEGINPSLAKPYIPSSEDSTNKKDYRESKDRDKDRDGNNPYRKKEQRYRGRDFQRRKREGSTSGGEEDRRSLTPEIELSDRERLSMKF